MFVCSPLFASETFCRHRKREKKSNDRTKHFCGKIWRRCQLLTEAVKNVIYCAAEVEKCEACVFCYIVFNSVQKFYNFLHFTMCCLSLMFFIFKIHFCLKCFCASISRMMCVEFTNYTRLVLDLLSHLQLILKVLIFLSSRTLNLLLPQVSRFCERYRLFLIVRSDYFDSLNLFIKKLFSV